MEPRHQCFVERFMLFKMSVLNVSHTIDDLWTRLCQQDCSNIVTSAHIDAILTSDIAPSWWRIVRIRKKWTNLHNRPLGMSLVYGMSLVCRWSWYVIIIKFNPACCIYTSQSVSSRSATACRLGCSVAQSAHSLQLAVAYRYKIDR